MPTLNNYTYSSVSYQITEGDNVTSEIGTAVITLEPVSGYSLDANDFALGSSFSDPNVDSVVFTQDGDNVLVIVTFVAGFVMPSENYNVALCIDGQGVAIPVNISGVINATVSANITGDSSETDTPYSASGLEGETVSLFSRTYTASSGYFLSGETILINGEENPEGFTITETPTYDSENRLVSITYNVSYTFTSVSYVNQDAQIVVTSRGIPVVLGEVTRWRIYNAVIPVNGDVRPLKIYGGPGAVFSVTLNDGSGPITIINNETLPASGVYEQDIQFDPVTADTTYTLTISGNVASGLNTTITLNQYILTDITFRAVGADFNLPSDAVMNGIPLTHYNKSATNNSIKFTWVVTSSIAGTLALDRQPEAGDISNFEEVYATIDGSVSNSTVFDVVDASNLAPGMEFNEAGVRLAPFNAEISTIVSNTITCNNPVTLNDGDEIAFTGNRGNYMNIEELTASLDSNEVTITAKIYFTDFGKDDVIFTISLKNFISQS